MSLRGLASSLCQFLGRFGTLSEMARLYEDRPTVPMAPVVRDQRREPPWSAIPHDVVRTVRALWDAGFEIISADGDVLGVWCRVVMRSSHAALVRDADRLYDVIRVWFAEHPDDLIRTNGFTSHVKASYSPECGVAILELSGVRLR